MSTNGNQGFPIPDASEYGGGAQGFHGRAKGPDGPPQLVITFG
jgi:hypothetical protein